ncbi:MAG: enolase C-terminal domain-like protein [Pseudomonadota bacterium]
MKIQSISVWLKPLPLKKPYFLSGGRLRFDALDATFVKLETDTGVTGWGEGTPWGHTYLPAHGPGIRAGIETMAAAIIGLDPRNIEQVERAMDLCLPGHLYAKAPIDMACWDILGKATGLSIATLLGGADNQPTRIVSSVSTGAPAAMTAEIDRFRDLGYQAHSVKVGADVALDIERIRAIESHRTNDEAILYDVNRAWTRAEALRVMNAVRDLDVTFEQPCETLDDIAAIRPLTGAPISIDESLVTYHDGLRVVGDGSGEIFNIKINRVGGLTKARRLRDLALANGIQMYIMPTGGTVLADTESTHLAQTIPTFARLGCWSCQDMIEDDPAPGRGARNDHGSLVVDDAPGLGVEPDPTWLGDPLTVYE